MREKDVSGTKYTYRNNITYYNILGIVCLRGSKSIFDCFWKYESKVLIQFIGFWTNTHIQYVIILLRQSIM